jgi:hypothetical protein
VGRQRLGVVELNETDTGSRRGHVTWLRSGGPDRQRSVSQPGRGLCIRRTPKATRSISGSANGCWTQDAGTAGSRFRWPHPGTGEWPGSFCAPTRQRTGSSSNSGCAAAACHWQHDQTAIRGRVI